MSANAIDSLLPQELPAGTVVGDRYQLEACVASDAIAQTYAARDRQTQKQAAVLLLSKSLTHDASVAQRIQQAADAAASLQHKSLIAVYGAGTYEDQWFIAREWSAGETAAELIAERKRQGKTLSVRGVYNLIAHVCKGLAALPHGSFHGALRPSIVWVTKAGRVKLSDIELGSSLVKMGRGDLLPSYEQAFLAPEAKSGGALDARADVFGVGALLYALLTARSPLDAFVIPSQIRRDASPELDAVMMRCLAQDKAQRFATADEVLRVLLPLVAATPDPPSDDFDVDVEVDIDVAASLAPPARKDHSASMVPVVIVNESVTPAANQHSGADDLTELTARLTTNDAPRWIAVKNGMDHGPFTARELIKLIVDGEVQEQHLLFNMASNQKKPLAEYSEFEPFVHQYKIRRDEQEHAAALERSTKVEKRSTAAKFLILGGSIAALALVGGGYWASRKAMGEHQRSDADLAALYESGQVRISGTAGILKVPPPHSGGRRSSGGSASGPGGFTSYEDAMNQAMELNMGKAGGERQLTSSDVAGVMNRELNRMFGCVGEELRHGGKLGKVVIDLAILGSGRVSGASVNSGSASFQRCIANKLKDVHFPDFPAPRMGARYSFSVD
jgi:serine/threonine protein kinase